MNNLTLPLLVAAIVGDVRRGLGEHLLEELLGQVLPRAHFSMQHEFSGGERLDDAVSDLSNDEATTQSAPGVTTPEVHPGH